MKLELFAFGFIVSYLHQQGCNKFLKLLLVQKRSVPNLHRCISQRCHNSNNTTPQSKGLNGDCRQNQLLKCFQGARKAHQGQELLTRTTRAVPAPMYVILIRSQPLLSFQKFSGADLKSRVYYQKLFWQAVLGYIGQTIIGVKVPNSSHVASIQY